MATMQGVQLFTDTDGNVAQLTGWDCNDNMVATATNLHGPWSDFRPFTSEGFRVGHPANCHP